MEPLIRTGLRAIGGLGAALSLVLIALPLDPTLRVSGQVATSAGRAVISDRQGGRVAEIYITDGAHVGQGDALLRLDDGELRFERDRLDLERAQIALRLARLRAEIDGAAEVTLPAEASATFPELAQSEAAIFAASLARRRAEAQSATAQRDRIRARMSALDIQERGLAGQIALLEAESGRLDTLLSRGLAEAGRSAAIARDLAATISSAAELSALRAGLETNLADFEANLAARRQSQRQDALADAADLAARFARLDLERARIDRALADRVLRAPFAGRAHGLSVQVGAVIGAGAPVLVVIAPDPALEVAAIIPPAYLSRVREGMSATLRLPDATAGAMEARVISLVPDGLPNADGSIGFRARLALRESDVPSPLVAGMPVELRMIDAGGGLGALFAPLLRGWRGDTSGGFP